MLIAQYKLVYILQKFHSNFQDLLHDADFKLLFSVNISQKLMFVTNYKISKRHFIIWSLKICWLKFYWKFTNYAEKYLWKISTYRKVKSCRNFWQVLEAYSKTDIFCEIQYIDFQKQPMGGALKVLVKSFKNIFSGVHFIASLLYQNAVRKYEYHSQYLVIYILYDLWNLPNVITLEFCK